MKKAIIAIIAVLLVIAIGLFGIYKYLTKPVSDSIKEVEVEIPLGTSTEKIATILKEKNLIRNELAFLTYVKLNKISSFQAGTYYLKECMTIKEITEMLQTGVMYDQKQITITYLEGKPMWYLADLIAKKTNNSEEDVYKLLKDEKYINGLIKKYWFIKEDIKNDDIYYPLEGYLFPDTYALSSADISVEEIFEKMLDRMEEVLDEYRIELENNKYTIHELLTIASIVETESMKKEDRKDISSVIYNRLKVRNVSSEAMLLHTIQ